MVLLARHLISLLLFIVIFSCSSIEARQGKVFINLVNLKNYIENNNVKVSSIDLIKSPSPSPSPIINEISFAPSTPAPYESGNVPAPAPSPSEIDVAPAPLESGIPLAPAPVESGIPLAPAPVESDNAYGLGLGSYNQVVSKKTSHGVDLVNGEQEIPRDEFKTESSKEFNAGESYNNNNNGYYSSSNTINGGSGYVQRQGLSDTRFLENGKYYYDVQKEKNYNHQNGYESEKKIGDIEGYYGDLKPKSVNDFDNVFGQRQGLSDTRFVENGRYYYDVQSEKNLNNENGYESVQKSGDNGDSYGDLKSTFDHGYGQRQGLSDTRFMENGKYYYDVQNENNLNNENGYGSVNGHNEGVYGGKSNNEFDNAFDTRLFDAQNEKNVDNEGLYGGKSNNEFENAFDTRFLDVQNENYNKENGDSEGFYFDKAKNEFENGFGTRFLDDVQKENYNAENVYESVKQSGDNLGYNGYKSNYGFGTTEEYQRPQGYYIP